MEAGAFEEDARLRHAVSGEIVHDDGGSRLVLLELRDRTCCRKAWNTAQSVAAATVMTAMRPLSASAPSTVTRRQWPGALPQARWPRGARA